MRKLLFLALLGTASWFVYTHWWPANNPQAFSGRLESAVNQELTRAGVTDRDVRAQVRKEHTFYGLTWIETQRTINVADATQMQVIVAKLSSLAKQKHCPVTIGTRDSSRTVLSIGLTWGPWAMVFQDIVLVPKSALHAKSAGSQETPKAAFVIDDVAYESVSMDRFAALGVPLTFAILPREKHSGELSRKANGLHFPVMLHLPMEPQDIVHNDPGPSALLLKMTDAQLKFQFDRDVASVPNIVGINNHMGSAFTENDDRMRLILGWVKTKNLYFLDSHTTGRSAVCRAAGVVGVPCLVNQTFLDNADDVKSIEAQLDEVMKLALSRGHTIAIGHYRRKHLVEALNAKIPEFQSRGIQIVTLPSLYTR